MIGCELCVPTEVIKERNVTVEVVRYVNKTCSVCPVCAVCQVSECKDVSNYASLLHKLEYLQKWQDKNMNATLIYEQNCTSQFNYTWNKLNEQYNITLSKLSVYEKNFDLCKDELCKYNDTYNRSWC